MTTPETSTIEINFNNMKQLRELMNTYGKTRDYTIFGQNEEGESQHIDINPDHIILHTFQTNHLIGKNIYWYDGMIEELFEGKWD